MNRRRPTRASQTSTPSSSNYCTSKYRVFDIHEDDFNICSKTNACMISWCLDVLFEKYIRVWYLLLIPYALKFIKKFIAPAWYVYSSWYHASARTSNWEEQVLETKHTSKGRIIAPCRIIVPFGQLPSGIMDLFVAGLPLFSFKKTRTLLMNAAKQNRTVAAEHIGYTHIEQ